MDIENQIPVAPTKVVVKRKSRINRQELTPEEVGQIDAVKSIRSITTEILAN